MADTKKRSGRSSSLQRMLDLEKQYRFERLNPPTNQPNLKSTMTSAFGTNHQAPPDHSGIHARRIKGNAQKSNPRKDDGRRNTSLPPNLSTLIINSRPPLSMSRTDLSMGTQRDLYPHDAHNSARATPDEMCTKAAVIAFDFPPKETAQCHSPSWESYERRKNEKKLEKRERGEAKEGMKKLCKKPPPPSSPMSLQQALSAEAEANRGRGRERAAEKGTSKEAKLARKARSRSGSFVSMLRAPFEFRRASQEHGNDSKFIGGIKLELQRHAAQQQNMDANANAVEDESNVHPALRQSNQEPKSSSSLQSPQTPQRRGTCSGTDQHRRYPPISRGNNHHHKAASLSLPPAPAVLDAGKIDMWRSKVGLKSGSWLPSRLDDEQAAHTTSQSADNPKGRKQQTYSIRVVQGPRDQSKSSNPSQPKPIHIAFAASSSTQSTTSAPPALSVEAEPKKQLEKKRSQYNSNNESVSSNSTATVGYKTAPSSPPPPAPPRRSSKRSSALSSEEPVPSVPAMSPQCAGAGAGAQPSSQQSKEVKSFTERSFPLLKNVRPNNGEQLKEDFENSKRTSGSSNQFSPYLPSPSHNGHLPTSSSEDSSPEDFQSISAASTPATSRPQSECKMPSSPSKEDAAANKARFITTYPIQSADNSEDEGGVDPIQAAAEKVLAVFSGIPVLRRGSHRRCNSQSSLATDFSFEQSAIERPLNIPSKKKTSETILVPPFPASGLEEVREQPATAALKLTYKQQQQQQQQQVPPPSAFFSSSADNSSDADRDSPKPALAVSATHNRHLRHKSMHQSGSSDRNCVAKIFVECCSCKHYHDMPRNLYEAMSDPKGVFSTADRCRFGGALSMTVRCSWCMHEMSVRCCPALATLVHIQEQIR